jgi:hypothetical protein
MRLPGPARGERRLAVERLANLEGLAGQCPDGAKFVVYHKQSKSVGHARLLILVTALIL